MNTNISEAHYDQIYEASAVIAIMITFVIMAIRASSYKPIALTPSFGGLYILQSIFYYQFAIVRHPSKTIVQSMAK